MRLIILALILILSKNILAQNLIPNHDFEELRDLPVKPNPRNSFMYEPLSGYKPFQHNLNYWFAATIATPDLRITDKDDYRDCNKKFDDCDKARSGIICAGIITYQKNKQSDSYREYIEIKLKEPLEAGVLTHVEFWVRRERQSKLITNNIGCYFSERKVYAKMQEVINVEPHINYDLLITSENSQWMKITGSFTPDKAYQFLTIGNFFKNEKTIIETYQGSYPISSWVPEYAYYLIDDIKVWNDTASELDQQEESIAQESTPVEDQKIIKKITLNHLEFDYDSAKLNPASLSELQNILPVLKNMKTNRFKVVGHTDDQGSQSYNQTLSEKRAISVMQYLINHGIDAKQLHSQGEGALNPIVPNDSDDNRQKNRRVEILIFEK